MDSNMLPVLEHPELDVYPALLLDTLDPAYQIDEPALPEPLADLLSPAILWNPVTAEFAEAGE